MFYSGDHFFCTTDRDVGSFVVLVFISLLSNLIISFYILIRELLYKLIHCLGYRAQPDLKVLHMRRGFVYSFSCCLKSMVKTISYSNKKRSKKLQIEYLLICLGYFCGLTHIVIGYAFILRKILESLKLTFTDFARYPVFFSLYGNDDRYHYGKS